MISRYRVLFTVPGFTRLLASSVLGRLPSGMFSLAILLFVRAQTGSFLTAGVAVGVFTLAGAAVSPLQGALVDRFGQPRVLLPCAVGQGLLLVSFVLVVGPGVSTAALLALAACAGVLLPPVSGCVRALWSEVAPDAQALETAYSLDAITQETIYTLGPLLSGAVAVVFSPAAAVLLCAAIVVVGTVFFASARVSRGWRAAGGARGRGGALSSVGLRALLASALFSGAVIGAAEVGLPALAVRLGAREAAGVLLALFSLGSMAGGVIYSARSWRSAVGTRYARVLLAVAVMVAPLMFVDSLAAALVFSVFAGLGIAPMLSSQFSLVGSLAPEGATTEAFAWHRGTTVAGIALGTALGGSLVERSGASGAFALGCAGAALACLLALAGRDRIERRVQPSGVPARPRLGVDTP